MKKQEEFKVGLLRFGFLCMIWVIVYILLQAEYERLMAAGDSWAMVTAMKNMWAKEQENAKAMKERNAKNNSLQVCVYLLFSLFYIYY